MVWQVLLTRNRAISIYIYDIHYCYQFDGSILKERHSLFVYFLFLFISCDFVNHSIFDYICNKSAPSFDSIKRNDSYTNCQFYVSHEVHYMYVYLNIQDQRKKTATDRIRMSILICFKLKLRQRIFEVRSGKQFS